MPTETSPPGSIPEPLVLDPRILRRVIKHDRRLGGLGLHVPHARCYVVGRESLLSVTTEREIGRAGGSLPASVILIARPEDERTGSEASACELWRRVFHARVHQALEQRLREGELSPTAVRNRIERIGQTEFDEVRDVLRQDDLLLSAGDDRETYVEFAAYYLELRHFAPPALGQTFPALRDHAAIDRTLLLDIDPLPLLRGCRPGGAPEEPLIQEFEGEEEPARGGEDEAQPRGPRGMSEVEARALREEAEQARRRGNDVRAALCEERVSRGGAEGEPGPSAAAAADRADLRSLVERLRRAVADDEEGPTEAAWAAALAPLVRRAADTSPLRLEARLLHDLQAACVEVERARSVVDGVGFALSLGKKAIVRDLPLVREVRMSRLLHAARGKVAHTQLSAAEKTALSALLEYAHGRAERKVRGKLGPLISGVFDAEGLRAHDPPERVAARKLVEELLDQILHRGFLGIGQLRDALSRSNLKLDNLSGPGELVRGDALLRVDRSLTDALDGVYRRGEIYLRGLQKVSSVAFGTRAGRAVSLHLLLPAGAAFVALSAVSHLAHAIGHALGHRGEIELLTRESFALTFAFLYAMVHVVPARSAVLAAFSLVGHALRALLIDVPRWVLRRPVVQTIIRSYPSQLLGRFVVKPLLLVAPLALLAHHEGLTRKEAVSAGLAAFVGLSLLLNTTAGANLQEVAADGFSHGWHQLHRRLLPGLWHLVTGLFRTLLESLDRGIYAVDEWLRFKDGQPRWSLWAKGGLGVAWFFLTYLVRAYANLLIEPQVNPIKHFPVVTVSHKIVLPFFPQIVPVLRAPLMPLGAVAANGIAGATVFLLPGVFGFLVWELKENFKLYRQNRRPLLEPISVGHHGETIDRLLHPGFHSGTVPKLYARMRRSISKGDPLAPHQEALAEIAESIRAFADRELAGLLRESSHFSGRVDVGRVDIGSNRIRIELLRNRESGRSALLSLEEQSGWLLASVSQPGWVAALAGPERAVFEAALRGFYKLSNVDVVREQIAAILPGGTPYDICEEGLVTWPGGGYQTEVIFPLQRWEVKAPVVRGEPPVAPPAALTAEAVFFHAQPISWDDWVALWCKGDPGAEVAAPGHASILPAPRPVGPVEEPRARAPLGAEVAAAG